MALFPGFISLLANYRRTYHRCHLRLKLEDNRRTFALITKCKLLKAVVQVHTMEEQPRVTVFRCHVCKTQ